jgi:hypothetical protein
LARPWPVVQDGGGAPPAANINVVIVQQEGQLQEGEGGWSWQLLLLLVASTSSTSGDNNNERNDNHNLHRWILPPHQALALHLNAWLYHTALSTACTAPLGHAIPESGMKSVPVANYFDNGKWQEWAVDDTCHVSMCECTSRHG